MKTLIAVPCMDTVYTDFMRSLLLLKPVGEVSYGIVSGTLIYDARNIITEKAINGDYDQILWLDSDMTFAPDILEVLSEDIADNKGFVSGLYFSRRRPVRPTIFQECCLLTLEDGQKLPTTAHYHNYPKNSVFEIKACGFGCVLMTREFLQTVTEKFGKYPFSPAVGFGEDLSFCMRAQQAGLTMYCDSRVKLGHIARLPVEERDYQCQIQRS